MSILYKTSEATEWSWCDQSAEKFLATMQGVDVAVVELDRLTSRLIVALDKADKQINESIEMIGLMAPAMPIATPEFLDVLRSAGLQDACDRIEADPATNPHPDVVHVAKVAIGSLRDMVDQRGHIYRCRHALIAAAGLHLPRYELPEPTQQEASL